MTTSSSSFHVLDNPSSWVRRFAPLIPTGVGEVLDLACGSGRHARWLAEQGHQVLAVDRDAAALARATGPGIATLLHDLEAHAGGDASAVWPFAAGRFKAVVVVNYLHRPLLPLIVDSLAAGGVLIYETFAAGNGQFGKPSNPAFLLQPGELLQLAQPGQGRQEGVRVVAFEDGYIEQPRPAMVQRLCARKPGGQGAQHEGLSPQFFPAEQVRLYQLD